VNYQDAKVLIVATCGPEQPERCVAPFFFAQKAADLGAKVNICFILQSPLLLKPGIAENLCAKEGGHPLSHFIHSALEAGVELNVCDAALKMNDMSPDDLIEEVDNLVGPSFLIIRGLEADLVLNF
jgi:hypothetical protein